MCELLCNLYVAEEKQLSVAGGIWSYWEKAQWRPPWMSPSASSLLWLHSFQNQTSILVSFFYFTSVTRSFATCSFLHLPCLSSISGVFHIGSENPRVYFPHKFSIYVCDFRFSRILPWLTASTVTTARSPCMAASTSNQTTAPTASPVTTTCSQTLVMSVKSWLAMMPGWAAAVWHDHTRSQFITCVILVQACH